MGLLDWLLNKDKVPELNFREDLATGAIYVELADPTYASFPQPDTPRNDARWYESGQAATIQNFTLEHGLVYVGTSLQPTTPYGGSRGEPSLINPALEIARGTSQEPLLYWRSYADLSPAERATYLTWLASGRRHPGTDIHYVYLYFFGLERRVLIDLVEQPDNQAELLEIREEVTRLITAYGSHNTAFRDSANMLLEMIDILLPPAAVSTPPPPPPLIQKGWEIPFSLRVRIGQFAANGIPIPPEWALAWVWYYPTTRLLTPALRCPDAFARLFIRKYIDTFGQGLKVRPGTARLRGVFRPANFSLGPIPLATEMVPNTFEHKGPIRKLHALFTETSIALDAYSRWLGRNPGKENTLPAVAQLPTELIDSSTPASKAFLHWADAHLAASDHTRVSGAEVVALWETGADKLTKAQSTALMTLAQHLGFGFEPDVRFGGAALSARDTVVLFRVSGNDPVSPSPAYAAATLLIHLAAAVAAADGEITRTEVGHLGNYVSTSLHLSQTEQTRLFAHLLRLAATDIKLTGLKKRIDSLDTDQRHAMGDLLVAIASSDGVISPAEVSILIKVFRLLRLDPNTVSGRIHATLANGGSMRPASITPAREASTSASKPLDPALIARIQAETTTVSSLLSDIFLDDETMPPTAPQTTQEEPDDNDTEFQGLDLPHARLLTALGAQTQWPRAEYERLASHFHVMPGGAIDVINDLAFDIIGDPVIEGDDILTINIDLIEELKI